MDEIIYISVVLSTYNDKDYIYEAINSILKQTYPYFEFIIVNDGSTDGTLDIIKSFSDQRIVLIDKPNTGLIDSLNIGVRAAKYDWIARMDGDDIAEPDRFEEEIKLIDSKTSVIASQCRIIDSQGKYIGKTKFRNGKIGIAISRLLDLPLIAHPTTMFRKDIYSLVGGYDKNMFMAEDYDLFCKMLAYGRLHLSNKYLLKLRKHGKNISLINQNEQKNNALIGYIKYLYRIHSPLPEEQYSKLRASVINNSRYKERFSSLGLLGFLMDKMLRCILILVDKKLKLILRDYENHFAN